jgi:hypothetical protein
MVIALRVCGVDVLTAYEDNASGADDSALLDRAATLGRVLFTQDDDLLAEATHRQRSRLPFAGVVFAHQLRVSIGACVHDLELIAKAGEPEDMSNRVQFLPLSKETV